MMVSLVFFLHPFLLVARGWVWSGSRLVLSLLPFPSPSHSPSHGAEWISKEVAFSSFCLVHLLPFPFPLPLPLAASNKAGGRALCLRAFNHLTCCCSCCFRHFTWLDARGVTPILEVIVASDNHKTPSLARSLVRLGFFLSSFSSFSLSSLSSFFKMRSSVYPSHYPVLSKSCRYNFWIKHRTGQDGTGRDGVAGRGHASVATESARSTWKRKISRNKAVSLFPTTNTKQPTPPPPPPIRASPTEDNTS